MSSLQRYRKDTIVILCPVDKTGPVIEARIIDKAEGRGSHKSMVKVQTDRPLDIFGDKHKTADGIIITPSDKAWLNPAEWTVIAKIVNP